jgi:phosphatidylserine/phosphatidylglycerophosphate/cardiolipin synthase-like enzyme/subtilisin family serine protease
MDPALQLLAEGDGNEEVEVIIRLHQADLVPPGVRLVAQFGTIATGRLRRDAIDGVRRDERVASMKAATLVTPGDEELLLSDTEEASEPSPESDDRRPSTDPATGRGVCVAVIDWGCAVDHPNFRHADGRTRLLALWDQSAPYDPSRPNRYGYGVIHTADEIDRALESPRPDVALGYFWTRSEVRNGGTHGSHVLDIAAGNGRADGPIGVAPEADLVFVQLVNHGTPSQGNLGNSVALLEAVDFALRTAGDRPICINTSMGRQMGPHDGTTLAELAFDAALNAAPGRALCCSTGNYFDRGAHSSGQLLPGQLKTVRFVVSESDVTPNELEVWYSGRDVLSVELHSPTGIRTKRTGLDDQASLQVDGREVCRLYHRARDPNNSDNEVHLYMFAPAPAGVWDLVLVADDIVVGRYDIWIERDATCPGCQSHFDRADVEPLTTTGTICNGSRTIAVGAYNRHDPTRPLASFSSSGPTRDLRVKPEVCAPGVLVLGARSTRPEQDDPIDYLIRKSGTSMAAPHVTGTVALMFEAAGRPLHIQETRNLLLRSTTPVEVVEEDAQRVGSGYLDVDAALARTRAYAAAEQSLDGGASMNVPEGSERDLGDATASEAVAEPVAVEPDPVQAMRRAGLPEPAALFRAVRGDGQLPGGGIEVVGRPGMAPTVELRPGDILLRRMADDGSVHAAFLATAQLLPLVHARARGWQLEAARIGDYAVVVEAGRWAAPDTARFARRILGPGRQVPPGQLLVRLAPPPAEVELPGDQEAAPDEAVPAGVGRWYTTGGTPPMQLVRPGNDVRPLVRGIEAFPAMVDAIRSAVSNEHYVYLLGWILDTGFQLTPGQAGSTFDALLGAAVRRGVQVRAMLWQSQDPFSSQNDAAVRVINRLTDGAAIHDKRTLNLGAHHQKVLVVKGREGLVGFCGGIDITANRIVQTSGGSGSGSGSGSGGGTAAGNGSPQHDVHCRIKGPAAFDLLQIFLQRWQDHPDHASLDRAKGRLRGFAETLPQQAGDVHVQIGRTYGNRTRHGGPGSGAYSFAPNGERTIRRQLLHAVARARRFIYLEDQYLVSQEMSLALVAALPNISHLTIVIPESSILSEEDCPRDLHQARRRFIAPLRAAGGAKVRVFVPSPVGGPFTYVHSKTWVFDDEFAVIGSANCNRRGYTHDSEATAAIYDPSEQPRAKRLRIDLWAAHLNLDTTAGRAQLDDGVAGGALWLKPPPGARVTPYNENAAAPTGQAFICRFASWDGAIDPDGS